MPWSWVLASGGVIDAATVRANASRGEIRRALRTAEPVHVGRDRYALPGTDQASALARR